jgi:hypothetical protein
MQMTQDVSEIHKFFGGLREGSRFTMIANNPSLNVNLKNWLSYDNHPSDENVMVHFKVKNDVMPAYRINGQYQYTAVENPLEREGCEILAYCVQCTALNVPYRDHKYSRCTLRAFKSQDFDTLRDIWLYNISWDYLATCSNRYVHIDLIRPHAMSLVIHSGAKSLPTICAARCAERTSRLEKAEFFAVLARRFGDTLADKLARATYD